MLVDVLNVLTKLCKTLQTRELLYSYVKPKIAIAFGELSGMKEQSGPALKSFENQCTIAPRENPIEAKWQLNSGCNIDLSCSGAMLKTFSNIKLQYLQSLVDNLEARLSSQSQSAEAKVLEACHN